MKRVLLFIFIMIACSASAQTSRKIRNLEAQRKKALAEIEATNQLLNENKRTTSNVLNMLNLLTKQIKSRKDVITLLNGEISATDEAMEELQKNIGVSERELQSKKEAYAQSLRKMYINQNNQNKLLFIFSAENFTQSYRRIMYLREFARWERRQAESIMKRQEELTSEKEKLQQVKMGKIALLEGRKQEEEKLKGEENIRQGEVKTLRDERKQLQGELGKQKKQAEALNRTIEKAINEEIARAEREAKAAEEARIRREAEEAARIRREKEAEAARIRKEKELETARRQEEGDKKKEKEKEQTAQRIPEKVQQQVAEPERIEERVAETKGGYAMTKEERVLSGSFVGNKGQLPYPLKGNYRVVSEFGQHKDQELKYVVRNNNGIDLQTTSGNKACSVFQGVVSAVFAIPNSASHGVIVRHGNYLTVYCNVVNLLVKQGDKVSTGQALGTIYTDSEEGNATILHFEIRKETQKLNPQSWLR